MAKSTSRKRLWLILCVGVLLICSGVFYIQFFLTRPTGSGPAGPDVDARAFQQVWTERRIRLVGIGDSVTAGLGADSPEHTFFNRLLRNPIDEFAEMRNACLTKAIPNLESENLALSGSNSRTHLEIVNERLLPQDPDVFGLVLMTTGGNDIIHWYGKSAPQECAMYGATLEQAAPWIEAFKVRLGAMLDTIEERFPGGCEIYLADIYDPTDGVGDGPSLGLPAWTDGLAIHAQYNQVISDCASSRSSVHVVPLYETFLGHGSHCRQFWKSTYVADDPHFWYFANIEDPNDRGYDAIRRVFLNEILEHSTVVPQNASAGSVE